MFRVAFVSEQLPYTFLERPTAHQRDAGRAPIGEPGGDLQSEGAVAAGDQVGAALAEDRCFDLGQSHRAIAQLEPLFPAPRSGGVARFGQQFLEQAVGDRDRRLLMLPQAGEEPGFR